ncbi:MAG: LptF/LptG family permease [Sporomusaceae bacterium]|nr:LptF/LptG family permease [Sporomusaceae bacterium]
MHILDRYLIKQFLTPALLSISGLSLLFLSSIIFDLSAQLIVRKVHPYLVFLLALYKLPTVLVTALPVGCFFGMVLSLLKLAKDKELLVMQMAGCSPWRLLLPYLIAALTVSGAAFFLDECVITKTNSKAELVLRRIIFDAPPPQLMQNVFFREENRYYFIGKMYPNNQDFQNIFIFEVKNTRINNLIIAQTGSYQNKVWTLNNGRNYEFDQNGHLEKETAYALLQIKNQAREESLLQVEKTPQDMSRAELASYIKELESQGIEVVSYWVDYHLKATLPLAVFFFAFLGLPLVMRVRAQAKVYPAALCVGIVFLYYVISATSASAGRAHLLTPIWAAWLPPLIFLLLGSIIILWVNND